MVRFALSLAGLALAAPHASAAHGSLAALDTSALVQVSRRGNEPPREAGLGTSNTEAGPWDHVGYAFEKFKEGALVEGKTSGGQWVPCVAERLHPENVWDIHVADRLPGYKLPSVPSHLLRRRLGEGESDWHVDNAGLQHSGFGLMYRLSKDLKNVSKAYAPWDSLVVGRDEGDGWLKVSGGYLPMKLDGARVLSERHRDQQPAPLSQEFKDWYAEKEAARRKAALSEERKAPPPPQHYSANEKVYFQGHGGEWHPAEVLSLGLFPDTYNLLAGPAQGSRYPALNVPSTLLRKVGPPQHMPASGESPLCQKQGCVLLRLQTESGKVYKVHAPMRLHVEAIMKMACRRLYVPWESCQTRISLLRVRGGLSLSPSWRTYEAGFKDDDVVELKLAPATATPVRALAA